MPTQLNRIAKYTTEQEFELVRDILSTKVNPLRTATLKKRIGILRRHADKARARAIAEARKGMSGDLSKRKADIFLDALQRCEHWLLDIEVKEARELHEAAARKALATKRGTPKSATRQPATRTAGKGMAPKPSTKSVPRLTAARMKGHVRATQRRRQAKRDSR